MLRDDGGVIRAPRDERLERRRRAIAAALVVAVATTAITGSAHATGGGAPPDSLLLVAAGVLTLVVLAPVLGARGLAATLPRQALAVVVAQLLQHGLYSLPEASAAAASAARLHAGHAHGASLVGAVPHEHAAMPLAHVIAGALTLGMLRLAPRLVDALLEAVSLRVALAVLEWSGPRPVPTASVSAERRASRRALDVLRGSLERRGPPLALV